MKRKEEFKVNQGVQVEPEVWQVATQTVPVRLSFTPRSSRPVSQRSKRSQHSARSRHNVRVS